MGENIFRGVGRMGGVRGGKDQFSWDDVKGKVKKDYFLGSSVKLNKPKWYLESGKAGDSQTSALTELQKIKEQEKELRMQQLGLKPKQRVLSSHGLEKHELKQLLAKNNPHDSESFTRTEGLGFGPSAHSAAELDKETKEKTVAVDNDIFQDSDKKAEKKAKIMEDSQHIKGSADSSDHESSEKKHKKSKKSKKEKKDKKHKKEKKDKKGDDSSKRKRHDSDED